MLTAEASEEIKAIRVLPYSGQQKDWDEWSKKYQGIAAERVYLKVMLGSEDVPTDALDIDQKVENKYLIPEHERKQEHLTRNWNQKGYRDLPLSTSKLVFQLVSLAKTQELPGGSVAKVWASLKDEYDPSEEDHKIKLLEDFQNNKLLNEKVSITEWLAPLASQVMKLNKLNHPINDDDYWKCDESLGLSWNWESPHWILEWTLGRLHH